MSTEQVVIGLDGGGTYTRVLCVDLAGNVLARVQAGGANPSKNVDAEANVQQAIGQVLAVAQRQPEQVAALVAGIAGLDEPDDQVWAARFTSLPGIRVKPHCVNDAVVAWAGALTLQPGIIVIAGSLFDGAMIPYALIGSVARTPYLQQQVTQTLDQPANKRYCAVEPAFSPEAGAVLLALQQLNTPIDKGLLQRLRG